nr:hypothetical protein CFP56_31671 [Quercus suber]
MHTRVASRRGRCCLASEPSVPRESVRGSDWMGLLVGLPAIRGHLQLARTTRRAASQAGSRCFEALDAHSLDIRSMPLIRVLLSNAMTGPWRCLSIRAQESHIRKMNNSELVSQRAVSCARTTDGRQRSDCKDCRGSTGVDSALSLSRRHHAQDIGFLEMRKPNGITESACCCTKARSTEGRQIWSPKSAKRQGPVCLYPVHLNKRLLVFASSPLSLACTTSTIRATRSRASVTCASPNASRNLTLSALPHVIRTGNFDHPMHRNIPGRPRSSLSQGQLVQLSQLVIEIVSLS